MKTSSAGLKLLRDFEGVVNHAYRDQAGHWTIGAGHLIRLPREKDLLSRTLGDAEIDALLAADLADAERAVGQAVKVALTQSQFDALVSLAFNIGSGGLATSTVVRRINAGAGEQEIREAWAMWNKVTDPRTRAKVVSDGLAKRRKREADLFFAR
jgi:lysozyme